MTGVAKKLHSTLILIGVLVVPYFAAFYLISLAPPGQYRTRQYSSPQTSKIRYGNSSTMSGAWGEQLLELWPPPGATNVPRDTSILIDAPRPEMVHNVSLNPSASIAEEDYEVYGTFGSSSSKQAIYPAGLLRPNTTYNISAVVAEKPAWYIFVTSSEPTQLNYRIQISSNDWWLAIIPASAATIAIVFIISRKRKQNFVAARQD